MVIAINDTLLESIKKELLVTLNAAESRVVDIFEFGETHGSEETLNLLRSAQNTLTMIGEQAAAALCEVILVTIEQSLTADNSEVQGELADSFLTLTQYIQRLSVDGEQHDAQLKARLLDEAKRNLLDETSSAAAASPLAYTLTDKQRQTLTKVRQFLANLPEAAANNPQNFWQGLYKAAKAVLPQLQTRENYEYIWLLEQIAVVNIKGAVATADDLQQQLYTTFVAYCDALVQQGESLSLYQQHGEDAVALIKQLIGSADVMRNDYTPPTKRLQQHDSDDLGISIVFPVSAETIESIAFLIKKELATTKNIFEKALQNNTLDTQAVRQQLSDSLASSKATFKLLGFATGSALIDEAENHLQQTAGDDSWQQAFAECVILIEDALWELDYLESGNMVNPYDAYHKQTAHSTKMAVIAAKLITAQGGHAFFKSARERLIESFAETNQLDLMHDAKAVHDLRSAMSLFDEEPLAEQLGKTERAQLFLINNPQVLAETSNTNAYLDVLVGYEIIFEQLRHSKTVDARALALLDSEIQKLLAGIHFNMEQMATPDYGAFAAMDADGHDVPQAALESLDTLPDLPEESSEAADSEAAADTLSDAGVASSYAAQQPLAPQSTGGAASRAGGAIANKEGSVNQSAGSGAEQTGAADSLAAALSQASINTEVESVPDSEIDEEILEIFLQEAKEISAQLENDIRQLKGHYFNEELLANLRRAFHTLKGSGRMVGLNVFGEFAWQHEKLFNKAVNNELQLNDIAQQWLETSQALVADVVNSQPFVEDKDALLQAAANAEAICKALTDGELDEIAPAVSAGDIGVGAGGEVRTGEAAADDLANLSDAEIDALAERLSARQAQASEALADVAGHPALGDAQAKTSEVGQALEKIAQVASLLNEMGDVKREDISPVFHAIGQIERDTLNEAQQAVAAQLAEIAETSKGLADNTLNNTHIEQISAAVGAMNSADLPAQLSDIMNGLQAIQDDLAAQASDTNLPFADVSWVLDYAQTTNVLYSQWAEEDFKKGSAFNGLHQNSITLEQMLLNNRLHQPIAISNKLRQLLDEINRRRIQKIGLTEAVTQSIGDGIDEVVRLLSAMAEQQTEVVASAEVLTALDNALATVQANYPAYDLLSGDEAVTGSSGMVNLAQQMEAQRSAGQADRFAQQGNEDELSAYFEDSAATLKVAKADFAAWQDADFAKNDALRQLREHVKQLRDGAFEVNHLDSRFVTQAIYDTLGNVNRSEKRPTANEAAAIKLALDELSRIHNEVISGEIGEANPLILNNLAEAGNSVLDSSPTEVQPVAPVQGVSSIAMAEADAVDDSVAKQGMATAYLGQAGDLQAQIEAAKREFTPANFITGAAEHSKLIDALYDVEASLDEQDSSTWAWEMLSNIEGIITNMQSKSLFPSPDDYQAISKALDAISDNKAVDAKDAKKINNSLMGIRAGLTGRELTRALAGKFASAAKEELQATDESFDAWKISGFEPRGELADLIGDVDEVDVKAEQMEYSDASELSSLLNTVLKRLQNENLIPYDMVSETVEKAIEEITAVTPQVHGGHLASPELRGMLDDHAIETSVGVKYVPLNDIDQLTDEPIEDISSVDTVVTRGVANKPRAAAGEVPEDVNIPDLTALATDLSDDDISAVTGAETTAQDAKAAAGTGAVAEIETTSQDTSAAAANGEASSAEASDLVVDKQGFAEAASPHIRQSRSHFDAWESGGFTDKQPLASLSSSFKDISEISESHHFQDAYDLASTVNDVLDRVHEEVTVPNEVTTESVNEAINEFDSTTQAIRRNDNSEGAQSISSDLLVKMRAVAAMPNLGKPVDAAARSDMPDGAASSAIDAPSAMAESVQASAADMPSLDTPAEAAVSDEMLNGVASSATDVPSAIADNVAAATAKTSAESVQTSATGMPVDALPELDADTVSSLQAFARHAQPHISASKSHFSRWQASDFMESYPRQQLLDSVQEITDLSEQHAVEDSANLGHAVNEVLQRLAAKDLRPNDAVATQLDSALTEFERTTQAIQQDAPEQTIRPDVLNDTQAVATAALSQLGQPAADYQPAPVVAATAAGLAAGDSQSGDAGAPITASMHVAEGGQERDTGASISATMQAAEADKMAPQASATDSVYLPFVKEAKPAIDASKDSFERWRATDFSLDEPLDSLSNDVKDITDISAKHDFSSGARLGQTVSEILERISEAGTRPALETTEQVESAINEFSRSAQAISDNAPYQDIHEQVISQIARVSQMIADDSTTSLTSSVAAHEIFTATPTPQPAAEQTQQAFSQGLESVMSGSGAVSIGDSSTERSEVSSMSAQLGDKGQKTGMGNASEQVPFGGLKFNDPEELDETILDIFLNEARDIVKNNDKSLNDWQADYGDLSALQEMQRGLHTLKGGARMAELTVLGDLSHNIETLLDAVVDGDVSDKDGASELLSAGLQLSDNMVMLASNRQAVVESPDYYAALSAFLRSETGSIAELVAPRPQVAPSMVDDDEDDSRVEQAQAHSSTVTAMAQAPVAAPTAPSKVAGRAKRRSSYMMRVSSELVDKLTGLVGEELILRSRQERQLAEHGFQIDELSRTVDRVSEQLRRLENETEAQILFRHETSTIFDEDFDPLELDRFSEIQQLSRLLAESMHDLQSIRTTLTNYVDETRQILIDQNNIQRGLQDGILSASMVRFDSVEARIERLVQQVADELNKEVEVQIYGGQNDIERNMLEDLIPGFEHTIRNSLTHGIETPDVREKAGKPRKGRIRIGVRREGAEIGFVIADDGRGANLDEIRQKARRLNMLDESRANDKNYLLQLLFEPGFSTQEQTTQLSGRGIGMDVLKDVVNARQGTIEIETEDNKGMATFIRMPFTMSITEALSVKIGQYRYAVPVVSVEGIARIPHDLYKSFELGQDTYYTYGQNRYKLESLIDFIDPYADRVISAQGIPALLVRIGSKRIAFEVEDIENRQEVIIKSVNAQFTSLPGIIGAAVLDSGQPVPVLEASALGRHFMSFQSQAGEIRDLIVPEVIPEVAQLPRILVVDDSITMRKVTTKILSKYEVEIQTAKDGLDAVDIVNDWMPDAILLDIEMPRMDGFEFATHVRNDSILAQVPIIMITSRTGEKHRERAKAIGVNDYLGKPYSEETLITSLQNVLGKTLKK